MLSDPNVQSLGRRKLDEVVRIFGEYRHRHHECDWACRWNWCPNYAGWFDMKPDHMTYKFGLGLRNYILCHCKKGRYKGLGGIKTHYRSDNCTVDYWRRNRRTRIKNKFGYLDYN